MRVITQARAKGERSGKILLERYPNISAPVPIKEIAIAEGCKLSAMVLDDDLSGMAFVKNDQKIIVYNARHHGNRQRFTIAHELAHHAMHKLSGIHVDKGVLRRDLTSAEAIDPKEIEANAFAATVLMPSVLISKYTAGGIDLEDDAIVSDLARKFGVSTTALTNRILNLTGSSS